jgi:hypothetical protein
VTIWIIALNVILALGVVVGMLTLLGSGVLADRKLSGTPGPRPRRAVRNWQPAPRTSPRTSPRTLNSLTDVS